MKTRKSVPRLFSIGVLWPVLLCLLVTSGETRAASVFPNRKAVHACSLRSVETDDLLDRNCQIESTHGEDSDANLLMSFGETNCTVELKNCVPGVCYSIVDVTHGLSRDAIARKNPSSFFSSISLAGAKEVSHTSRGVSFRSEEKTVVLRYSTHTCSDFYWYHGREKQQLCDAPYAAVMSVDAGTPYSLPCSA